MWLCRKWAWIQKGKQKWELPRGGEGEGPNENYLLSIYVSLDTVLGSKIAEWTHFLRKNDQGKQYCKREIRAEISVKYRWRSFRYLKEEILAEKIAASKVLRWSRLICTAEAEWVREDIGNGSEGSRDYEGFVGSLFYSE